MGEREMEISGVRLRNCSDCTIYPELLDQGSWCLQGGGKVLRSVKSVEGAQVVVARGNSSESGEREEYGGNVIMMMNMPLNATTQDSHSRRGLILM